MNKTLFDGLQELKVGNFPKICPNCGRVYRSFTQFLAETKPLAPDKSGLKSSLDENDQPLVELFRNCVCGSTLMDFYRSRRDHSENGERRRVLFNELLAQFVARGLSPERASDELRVVMSGKRSELLETLLHK